MPGYEFELIMWSIKFLTIKYYYNQTPDFFESKVCRMTDDVFRCVAAYHIISDVFEMEPDKQKNVSSDPPKKGCVAEVVDFVDKDGRGNLTASPPPAELTTLLDTTHSLLVKYCYIRVLHWSTNTYTCAPCSLTPPPTPTATIAVDTISSELERARHACTKPVDMLRICMCLSIRSGTFYNEVQCIVFAIIQCKEQCKL